MEKLATAVERYTQGNQADEPNERDCGSMEGVRLQRSAEAWAVHALRTYTGENLAAALDVSKALCTFVHRMTIEPR